MNIAAVDIAYLREYLNQDSGARLIHNQWGFDYLLPAPEIRLRPGDDPSP